jgi:hypothetical protein
MLRIELRRGEPIDLKSLLNGDSTRLELIDGHIEGLYNVPQDETMTLEFENKKRETITFRAGLYDSISKIIQTANDIENREWNDITFTEFNYGIDTKKITVKNNYPFKLIFPAYSNIRMIMGFIGNDQNYRKSHTADEEYDLYFGRHYDIKSGYTIGNITSGGIVYSFGRSFIITHDNSKITIEDKYGREPQWRQGYLLFREVIDDILENKISDVDSTIDSTIEDNTSEISSTLEMTAKYPRCNVNREPLNQFNGSK